jgi:hypothetical protein
MNKRWARLVTLYRGKASIGSMRLRGPETSLFDLLMAKKSRQLWLAANNLPSFALLDSRGWLS